MGKKVFYIADFYCARHKLVIEVDGPIHLLKKEYDDNRNAAMIDQGFRIIRVTNDEILTNINTAIEKVMFYCLA